MANFTTYEGGEVIANGNGMNNAGFPSTGVMVAEFDASKRNLAISDTVDIATIPAGTIVNSVVMEVLALDAASIAVGGSGGSAYVATTVVDTVGETFLGAGAQIGELTTAETQLRLTATVAAADTAKVRVYVDMTVIG